MVMFPPKKLWMLAPKLPTTDRDRTTIPRTTPKFFIVRYPATSNAVVVKGCVVFISPLIQH
jgi:hypothetical protein